MLSVVITAWNEEANLPRALASVKGLADEIVVVDTESTDKTVEIAKKFGCKVFHHKYPGIVEPVRNFSISKAKGDWVFLLDADEEVTPELAKFIKDCLASNQADYYRLPRKNLIFGRFIKSEHWWPDYVYRLFRKGYVVWDDAIHSIPHTRGVGQEFPAEESKALIHHNYQTMSQYVLRLDRYTDNQLKLLIDKQVVFSWRLLITKPMAEFLSQYFARNGFKEGIHGLILSGMQAFSEFVLYAKYWQYLGQKSEDISASDFASAVRKPLSDYQWWSHEKIIAASNILVKPAQKVSKTLSVLFTRYL